MEIKNYNARELTLTEKMDVSGGGPLWKKIKKFGPWGLVAWVFVEVIDNWPDVKDGAAGGWEDAMNE